MVRTRAGVSHQSLLKHLLIYEPFATVGGVSSAPTGHSRKDSTAPAHFLLPAVAFAFKCEIKIFPSKDILSYDEICGRRLNWERGSGRATNVYDNDKQKNTIRVRSMWGVCENIWKTCFCHPRCHPLTGLVDYQGLNLSGWLIFFTLVPTYLSHKEAKICC